MPPALRRQGRAEGALHEREAGIASCKQHHSLNDNLPLRQPRAARSRSFRPVVLLSSPALPEVPQPNTRCSLKATGGPTGETLLNSLAFTSVTGPRCCHQVRNQSPRTKEIATPLPIADFRTAASDAVHSSGVTLSVVASGTRN